MILTSNSKWMHPFRNRFCRFLFFIAIGFFVVSCCSGDPALITSPVYWIVDSDGDQVEDLVDNCPLHYNPTQDAGACDPFILEKVIAVEQVLPGDITVTRNNTGPLMLNVGGQSFWSFQEVLTSDATGNLVKGFSDLGAVVADPTQLTVRFGNLEIAYQSPNNGEPGTDKYLQRYHPVDDQSYFEILVNGEPIATGTVEFLNSITVTQGTNIGRATGYASIILDDINLPDDGSVVFDPGFPLEVAQTVWPARLAFMIDQFQSTTPTSSQSVNQLGYFSATGFLSIADIRDPDPVTELTKITSGTDDEGFGLVVSLDGNTLAVSALRYFRYGGAVGQHSDSEPYSGTVYVFTESAGLWNPQAQITSPSVPVWQDRFGISTALSGQTLVIGAPDLNQRGSVHVFTRDRINWSLQQTIHSSETTRDYFGYSVAILGDVIAVGATLDEHGVGFNAGAVYLYERTDGVWTLLEKLTASDGVAGDAFGSNVAISPSSLIVSAAGNDDRSFSAGAVYVFRRQGNTWSEFRKLIASDGNVQNGGMNYFGGDVAIDGNSFIASASGYIPFGIYSGITPLFTGAAYVFGDNGCGWNQQGNLLAFVNRNVGLTGGSSVDIDGHTVVVAGKGPTAHRFTRVGKSWFQDERYEPSDLSAIGLYTGFGATMSMNATNIAIGAPYDRTVTPGRGSVYIFPR